MFWVEIGVVAVLVLVVVAGGLEFALALERHLRDPSTRLYRLPDKSPR